MASRPFRLPYARWGTWFLILGLVSVLIGCGRHEEAPAVVEDVKSVDDNGATKRVDLHEDHEVTYGNPSGDVEGLAGKPSSPSSVVLFEPTTPPDGRSGKYMYNLTTRSLVIYGRSR